MRTLVRKLCLNKMNNKIPTLLGIISVTVGVIAGVLLVKNQQAIKLYAAQDATPRNVRVTNVSDASMTVSWTTLKKTSGFVRWGSKENSMKEVSFKTNEEGYTHSYTLNGLTPSTAHYFIINSDGTYFDNNEIPWQSRTGPKLPQPESDHTMSGSVIDPDGFAVSNALIYVVIGGGSPMSTTTSTGGSWVLPVSSTRTLDLLSYILIDPKDTLIQLHVQTGKDVITTRQLYLESAQPAPVIVLGEVDGFKTLFPKGAEELPEATIKLREKNEQTGFGELIIAN